MAPLSVLEEQRMLARLTMYAGSAGAVLLTARAAYRWFKSARATGDWRGNEVTTRYGKGAAFASHVYGRALWGVVAGWAGVISFRYVAYRPFFAVGAAVVAAYGRLTGVGYVACYGAGWCMGPFVKHNPKTATVVLLSTLAGHMAAVRACETPLAALLTCAPASLCYSVAALPLVVGVPQFELTNEPVLQGQLLVSSLLTIHTWYVLEGAVVLPHGDRQVTLHAFGILGVGAYAAWSMTRLVLRSASLALTLFMDEERREKFQRDVQPALDVISGAGLTGTALAFAYSRARVNRAV